METFVNFSPFLITLSSLHCKGKFDNSWEGKGKKEKKKDKRGKFGRIWEGIKIKNKDKLVVSFTIPIFVRMKWVN